MTMRTPAERRQLGTNGPSVFPLAVAGTRYGEEQMKMLDSER